jgi:hypothetical protein
MRSPKDFELNKLCRDSGGLTFDDSTADRYRQLAQSGKPFRNCHPAFGKWCVIVYAGNAQRRIGLFDSGYHASRFANMATYYFWKYRRTERACTDEDLIYGIAQAKADLEFFLGAAAHLANIEGHLISIGVLAVGAEAEEKTQAITLRSQFRKHSRAWTAYLKALRQLETNFSGPAGKAHFEAINDSAARHAKLISGIHQLKPTD